MPRGAIDKMRLMKTRYESCKMDVGVGCRISRLGGSSNADHSGRQKNNENGAASC